VIEDAAQSYGATYKGRSSCNLSQLAITSFYPAKPLGCYGDGGAVFTNDDELAKRVKEFHNHGMDRNYHHKYIGLNARFDGIQAGILLEKLAIFPEEIKARQLAAAKYTELLKDIVTVPVIAEANTSTYAQYTIRTLYRDQLIQHLKEHDIPTAVHYPMPIHQQPAFANLSDQTQPLPVAEMASKQVMSLPMHPYLSDEDINKVCQHINDFVKQKNFNNTTMETNV